MQITPDDDKEDKPTKAPVYMITLLAAAIILFYIMINLLK